jgi:hypothetical protein
MQTLMLVLFAAVVGLGIGFVGGRVWEIRRDDLRAASRYSTRSLNTLHAHQPASPEHLVARGEPPIGGLSGRVTSSLRDGSQL